ncbi:MAG: NAD(P)H-dependent oxidoreductase [Candidatus Omnitrophica bacterium]|nr:NAD(P)H-dependent oxidoreductase [Candidatus Omnitrophota bacterium]
MAQLITEGVRKEKIETTLKKVQELKAEDLLDFDGVIIGSPIYYGGMASQIKELFDKTVKFHGSLDGKVGGAFSSSANIGGGNETTILGILNAMLIHGMIIQGDPSGDHYGPVAIDSPDSKATKQCVRFGRRMAKLVKKLAKN